MIDSLGFPILKLPFNVRSPAPFIERLPPTIKLPSILVFAVFKPLLCWPTLFINNTESNKFKKFWSVGLSPASNVPNTTDFAVHPQL